MARRTEGSLGRRRVRAVVVGAVAVLLLVLVAAVLHALVNPTAITSAVQERVLPQVSATLGREVTVRRVDVRFFPRPQAVLDGVRVAGGPGEPALVDAARVSLRPRLWPLFLSRGRDIRIDQVVVRGARVTLVKRADGRWSFARIRRQLAARPAGKEHQLVVSEARLENGTVQVVDLTRGPAATVALDHLDATLSGVGPGLPLHVKMSAALAADRPNVTLDATIDPLPATAKLTRAELPRIVGTLSLKPLDLQRFQAFLSPGASSLISQGVVALDAKLGTPAPGRYLLEATGSISSLRVRGQPANGGFQLALHVDGEQPLAATAEVTQLHLAGPGVDVQGQLTASLRPLRIRYALTGRQLDLDTLLGPGRKGGATSKRPTKRTRAALATADVQGTVHFDEVRSHRLEATQVDAQAQLREGVLQLTSASARLYGGTAALDGTQVDLTGASPAWRLKANVDGLDLASAMRALSSSSPLVGQLRAQLDVRGDGEDWPHVRETLTGSGTMKLTSAALTTMDLSKELAPALGEALRAVGKPGAATKVEGMPEGTPLKNLGGAFVVRGGWIVFAAPLSFATPVGGVELSGRVGLDQRLDFAGTVRLSAGPASALTGGLWSSATPLPIPVKLSGTLGAPKLAPVDPQALVRELALGQASKQLGLSQKQLQQRLEEEAKKRLRDLGL